MITFLIVMAWVVGYLLIGALIFRRLVVWYLDRDPGYDHKPDRDDLLEEDLGWILAGAFFWPITVFGWAFYKLVIKQLWHRPTPGEKKEAAAKLATQMKIAEAKAKNEL